MLSSLKRSSLAFSKQLGLYGIVAQSSWRRQRLLILCYHGISLDDEHCWNPGLYVSAPMFSRRMKLLQRNDCTVLPLAEALDRLYRDDLPERAVALTFDDGYYDFLARAWPVLQAYGYPATVYLPTARVDHNTPIASLLVSYMFWKTRHREFDGTGLPGLSGAYSLRTIPERQHLFETVDRSLRGKKAGDKDAVARDVARRLGLDYDAMLTSRLLTLMRPQEVAELARQGLDVQLHTHLHQSPEDPDRFVRDVLVNRERIESITGKRPTHLCYPSGMYRTSYLPALRDKGIVSATTCDPGMAVRAGDPLLLPRFVDTTMITDVEFEAWVTGVACCFPRRTTRAHPLAN